MDNKCLICSKRILTHARKLQCLICKRFCHLNCISIRKCEVSNLNNKNDWYCMMCMSAELPFLNIVDDDDFILALSTKDHFEIEWENSYDKIFNPITLNDNERDLPLDDIDPDDNFYNDLSSYSSSLCKYYLQDSFNSEHAKLVAGGLKPLSFFHLNVRSLPHNFSQLHIFLDSLCVKFSILGITETWLTDSNCELFNLPDYNFIEKHRTDRSGGGVGLYLQDHIEFKEREDLNIFNDIYESIFIEIIGNSSKNTIVGVIYRPPGSNLKEFYDAFNIILSKIKSENKICHLMGDWNIDLLNYDSHVMTSNCADMFYSFGFVPLINRPTRITNNSATIIDNIFTNNHEDSVNASQGIFITDISDHFPIFHLNKVCNDTNQEIDIVKRIFKDKNKQEFVNELKSMNWEHIYNTHNFQTAFSSFHQSYFKLFDKHFPKKKINIKHQKHKPWLSDGLKACIKEKNKLYYKNLKFRTAYNELKYTTYRNKLKSILIKAEKDYYSKLLDANKGNMRKTWGIIKDIINKNRNKKIQTQFKVNDELITTDKTLISEKFNDFFINVGPTLASKIPEQSVKPEYYLSKRIENSIFLSNVNEKEFDNILKSLKNGSPGHDEINKDILELSIPHIKNLLIFLLNQSLLQGIFPEELKIANVVPLFKNDDSMKFNNYRPVSLLCTLSKVFEKVMYNRLISFLEREKILYEKQFGFRKKHSTYMALMILIDKLIKSLEKGEYILGIFLDFSKAFDTVDHSILITKLNHYGIRGIALDWFVSYLNNRKQFVTYNGVRSSMKTVKCGVPQGSILGPILFLLYINDLASICKKTLPFLFADDTNLFICGDNPDEMVSDLNSELEDISSWLKTNKLSLNVKKTHYMLFSSKRNRKDILPIKIDNNEIEEVEHTKFLGVFIDNKLNWKKHISYISGKISRGLGVILKAKKILNASALKTLYFSFIYPYFTYCNQVWGSSCNTNLRPLIMLQKRCIRIICSAKYREHTDPLFTQLGLLKLEDINKYMYGKFMYRCYHTTVPELFNNIFTSIRDVHKYNTRQSNQLYCPKIKTNLGKTKFSYRGPYIWNHIVKNDIDPNTTETVFSKSIYKIIMNGKI